MISPLYLSLSEARRTLLSTTQSDFFIIQSLCTQVPFRNVSNHPLPSSQNSSVIFRHTIRIIPELLGALKAPKKKEYQTYHHKVMKPTLLQPHFPIKPMRFEIVLPNAQPQGLPAFLSSNPLNPLHQQPPES